VSNVSLARIMYGTNENARSFTRMSSPGLSSVVTQNADSSLNSAVGGQGAFEELLRKAWLAISAKH
jgi:hypothetical protein